MKSTIFASDCGICLVSGSCGQEPTHIHYSHVINCHYVSKIINIINSRTCCPFYPRCLCQSVKPKVKPGIFTPAYFTIECGLKYAFQLGIIHQAFGEPESLYVPLETKPLRDLLKKPGKVINLVTNKAVAKPGGRSHRLILNGLSLWRNYEQNKRT